MGAAMDKERRQQRGLVALLAVGLGGLAIELVGATCGEHGVLAVGLGMVLTLGGAFAFFGYRRQEARGERR